MKQNLILGLVFGQLALLKISAIEQKLALGMTNPKKFTPLQSNMFLIVRRFRIQVVISSM